MDTITVGHLKRILAGLPDDQPLLLLELEGTAVEIIDIEAMTVTDSATGNEVLTLEFEIRPDRWYGIDNGRIDSAWPDDGD